MAEPAPAADRERRLARRAWLAVGLILLVALALRVGEIARVGYAPVNDANSYLKLASEIAQTGGYASHDPGAGATRGPSAYFPPGYPYFLAAVEMIDGHAAPRGSAVVGPARVAGAVLGTVTVAAVGLVAFELFDATVALVAMALAALYPVMIELSGVIVAENLLVPLVLGAIWAVLRARRAQQPWRWVALAGLLSGLATLTHENAVLLVIPLAVAAWGFRRRGGLRALELPALLLAVTVLTIAPWTIRNAEALHHFIPVSDETGLTLRGTYNPESAAFRPVPYKWRIDWHVRQDRPLTAHSRRLTEYALDTKLQSRALSYIASHPTAPLVAGFYNTLRLLELEGSFAWHASARAQGLDYGTAAAGVMSFWLLCVLALLGALTPTARRAPRWLWLAPALFALSVVLVNVETPRFRAAVDPFLVLLAACALSAAIARLRRAPIRRDFEPAPPRGDRELVDVSERLA